MIFRTLTLTNFGLYGGEQEIELLPAEMRPVVLIGGTNGAGKTTILEALTLALHGRRSLGSRVSVDEYEAHVRSRFHAPANQEPAAEMSVALAFDHVENGRPFEYVVNRTWRRTRTGRVKESLQIVCDSEPVDDLTDEARQDFLDGLLPPGLASFFLFDGEKIQALADDESGEQLGDAVRRLLGLDLTIQLQRDLRRYVATAENEGEGAELASRLKEARRLVEAHEQRLVELRSGRGSVKARFDQLAARADRVRSRFAAEGGALASERARLEEDARQATAELAAAEEELRLLITGLLPFAVAPQWGEVLASRLAEEQLSEEDDVVERRLNQHAPELTELLQRPDAAAALAAVLVKSAGSGRGSRLHDLTAADRAVLLDQLAVVRTAIRSDAARLGTVIRAAQERVERAEQLKARIPNDDALAPILSELQELERAIGAASAELEQLDEEIHVATYDHTVAERQLRKAEETAAGSEELSRTTTLALRTVELLDDYARLAEEEKLAEIELEATRYFNRLSRKGELLSRIAIDPETFRVAVLRWDGTELPKERLSAGEKQLFAIAVLWALARAARRPLPVVIDTPLARLDRMHRQKLLHEYFPHVSHQVVVLSTDTEVDAAAARDLEPVLARTVQLSYDTATGATSVESGYFREAEDLAHAR